jgi:hypothetical protein
MYTVSSKSADANAARVEAAANDRLKRGEAANQYSSFDDAPGGGGATTMPNVGRDDGQVVHNPLFDVDAFVEKVATAPVSESWHAVPAPAVELAPQSDGGDAECQLSRGAIAPATPVTVAARKPGSVVKQVIALQPHKGAEGSDELSFPKDAVMFVVAQISPQHWKGVWEGKAGLIPTSKVQGKE